MKNNHKQTIYRILIIEQKVGGEGRGELGCPLSVSSSSSTCGTHRGTLVTNPAFVPSSNGKFNMFLVSSLDFMHNDLFKGFVQ
jgi:hypothetical protein